MKRKEPTPPDGNAYPANWPETLMWLTTKKYKSGKYALMANYSTRPPQLSRDSQIVYGGSKEGNRPVLGRETKIISKRICEDWDRPETATGYLHGFAEANFQHQAAINTAKKLASVFRDKILCLNKRDAIHWKPPSRHSSYDGKEGDELELFSAWATKENGGYTYFPKWFEQGCRVIQQLA
tara:strand:+ start:1086 stop:1628 length:543 start_codon:yes stop_codon:yes gene_type:complete